MRPDVERELIRRCQRGDKRFYGPLVQAYESAGLCFAVAILGTVQDARDALTEAFTTTFRSLERFEAHTRFDLWFFRVLRSHCVEVLLRPQRRGATTSVADDAGATSTGADASLQRPPERRASHACFRHALGCIGQDHREILILKEMLGFRYGEIAEILAIPEEAVVERLFLARLAFRQALDAMGAGPPWSAIASPPGGGGAEG